MIDLNQLGFFISHHRNRKGLAGQTIGSSLKHYRLQKNLTLEEVSDGICSVSYLSKLENNLLIPTDKYLLQLKDKLKLTDLNLEFAESNVIHQMLDAIENDDLLKLEDYEKFFEQFDYRSKLIKYAYDIYNHIEFDLSIIYSDLIIYASQFTTDEFILFLYVTALYLYKESYFKKVVHLTKSLLTFEIDRPRFMAKVKYLNTVSLYRCGSLIQIDKKYQSTLNMLIDRQMINYVIELQKRYLLFLSKYLSIRELKTKINGLNHLNREEKHYIKAVGHFSKGNYDKVLEFTKNILTKKSIYFIIHLCALDKLKKHEVILDLLTKHKSLFKTLDKHEKIIMEYLEKKCRKDSTLLNFLKTKIMGTYFTSEDFDYRQYLLGELKNLYRDKKYYKEALKVSEQIADEIKEAAKIE